MYLDLDPNWKERRWIELWTRLNPDSIGYRKPRKEKDKGNHFRHLQMKMRSLFILYPDKKFFQCYQDEADNEKYSPIYPGTAFSRAPSLRGTRRRSSRRRGRRRKRMPTSTRMRRRKKRRKRRPRSRP